MILVNDMAAKLPNCGVFSEEIDDEE